jgi:hypothetical protein
MSNSQKLAVGLALLGACAAAGIIACESVPLTAAPGTMMTLIANPEFVIANGGISVVTAILVEPAGTFVPDGTEVFFFTNLGRVDGTGKTRNGVARVNFVSDARSGIATVVAISGGPAPTPGPSPSPTPTPATRKGGGTPDIAAALSLAADENSASVEISVGNALPARVLVTADPPRISTPRYSRIVATVFDQDGNPVQNVPVSFSIALGDPLDVLEETLDSGGALLFTNSNGQVTDVMRTDAPIGLGQKTVTVTATTATGETGPVTVFID